MTIDQIIEAALQEDIGTGDHTSLSAIPKTALGKSRLIIKEDGILCGVDIAIKVFEKVDPTLVVTKYLSDGIAVKYGDIAFIVEGSSISILTAERLVLNFMQRMSGIATVTQTYVKRLEGTNTKLLDTRKTTPLMRVFEKYAVKTGGGENHRFGLFDMIMIKDNHIDFAGGIAQAIAAVKTYLIENRLDLKIEIEARSLSDVKEILRIGGVDRIMLDNFNPELMKEAIKIIGGSLETEASGGITIENLREYALTGVDYISVGALTHHIKSLDMSLKAIS
ncbi:MAG: carboxylating nicotinate-nucleotide diphosphorylase [Bacteroidetes bacterium]|nr:carboxylating nicotinate-nucleotide diphosphorylase [Bacteroidota bacterium]